jgi:hypothetical protein
MEVPERSRAMAMIQDLISAFEQLLADLNLALSRDWEFKAHYSIVRECLDDQGTLSTQEFEAKWKGP